MIKDSTTIIWVYWYLQWFTVSLFSLVLAEFYRFPVFSRDSKAPVFAPDKKLSLGLGLFGQDSLLRFHSCQLITSLLDRFIFLVMREGNDNYTPISSSGASASIWYNITTWSLCFRWLLGAKGWNMVEMPLRRESRWNGKYLVELA